MKKVTSNTIIAVSALFVSVCALVVSIQEVRTMRTEQKAMLYPHLSVTTNYNAEGFSVILKNSGTGLALVQSLDIALDGTTFGSWLDMVDAVMPSGHNIGYNIVRQNTVVNQVITPGESVVLFGFPWNDETRYLHDNAIDAQVALCYCSLLGECWNVRSDDKLPVRTEGCEAGGDFDID